MATNTQPSSVCRVATSRSAWKTLFLLGVITVSPGPGSAQPLVHVVPSIDSLAINADYVYVARIVGVRDEPIPGGSDMPGFTFEVEAYLKTPMKEELTPQIERRGMFVNPPTAKYKDWMKRSSRLLILSDDLRPHQPVVIELTPNKPDILTADFKLLHEADEIILAARDAIERTPSNVRKVYTHSLMVPRELYKGTHWEGGDGLMLEVPADVQLETWAIKSIRDEDPWNRLRATQSLRYFKSKSNAKLIAELLKDPAADVREAANRILQRWEMETRSP